MSPNNYLTSITMTYDELMVSVDFFMCKYFAYIFKVFIIIKIIWSFNILNTL